jgi:hypothetical protein
VSPWSEVCQKLLEDTKSGAVTWRLGPEQFLAIVMGYELGIYTSEDGWKPELAIFCEGWPIYEMPVDWRDVSELRSAVIEQVFGDWIKALLER